jgi:glycosyltransferase involved in cell wall biosynthesis
LANLVKQYIERFNLKVLHIHDLYLFEVGLILKKKYSDLKLVGDLHENYVEGLKHYKFANTFPGKFLISIRKWQKSEIEWCNNFDYLITVIEEALERYSNLGVNTNNMFVVPNYVNLQTFTVIKPKQEILEKYKDFMTLTYVGGFDKHRGLESTVKAVPLIVKSIPNFKLVLVGAGSNLGELKEKAAELGIENYIAFEGWQQHENLSSYIYASTVCLIPHLKTVHTDNTIPHKLFQYMFLRKPVLSSNCIPLERIINETETGYVFESNNHENLAEKTVEMFKNPEKLKIMGNNGYKAVNQKYNWNAGSKKLIELYESI